MEKHYKCHYDLSDGTFIVRHVHVLVVMDWELNSSYPCGVSITNLKSHPLSKGENMQ